jgi:hypothetical protein
MLLPLGGFIVALVLGEVLFRVTMSVAKPKSHPSDIPRINYIPEQAFLTRDFYYPPEKPSGAFRIIVIGDSFTFGGKVHFDDTFPKRLERMLNLNRNGRKVEVLNWGVPGYSTAHEVQLFKDAVATFNPDLPGNALVSKQRWQHCVTQSSVSILEEPRLRCDESVQLSSVPRLYQLPPYHVQ